MATINAASSTNRVNRMLFSNSVTLLQYSDRNTTSGEFVGAVQFVARITGLGRTVTKTNPFTIS